VSGNREGHKDEFFFFFFPCLVISVASAEKAEAGG